MFALTPQQAKLLEFIRSEIARAYVAPTFDEMRAHIGVGSKSGIARMLDGLEERGAIRRLPCRARAIEVLPSRHVLAALPDAALKAEYERRRL